MARWGEFWVIFLFFERPVRSVPGVETNKKNSRNRFCKLLLLPFLYAVFHLS